MPKQSKLYPGVGDPHILCYKAHGLSESESLSEFATEQSELDPVPLYLDLALGARIGSRTVFEGVKCHYRTGDRVDGSLSQTLWDALGAGGLSKCDPEAGIRQLATALAGIDLKHTALELTSGIDSRLNLALLLSQGALPALAFTLGEPQDRDVLVAASLCREFQIPHHVVPVGFDPDRIYDDMLSFVRRSGYHVNAASYGWLPSIFRQLDEFRSIQISGVGGECIGGFYHSPLDELVRKFGARRIWAHLRLKRPGSKANSFFVDNSVARIAWQDIDAALPDQESWRTGLNRLYDDHRIRQWALPALIASSQWYSVVCPFLTPEYLLWCRATQHQGKDGRQTQRLLIERLHPDLNSIADCAVEHPAAGVVSRSYRRLTNRPKTSDLGANSVARFLASDERTCHAIRAIIEPCKLNKDMVEMALRSPDRYAHEIGALMTYAIAWKDLSECN